MITVQGKRPQGDHHKEDGIKQTLQDPAAIHQQEALKDPSTVYKQKALCNSTSHQQYCDSEVLTLPHRKRTRLEDDKAAQDQ